MLSLNLGAKYVKNFQNSKSFLGLLMQKNNLFKKNVILDFFITFVG